MTSREFYALVVEMRKAQRARARARVDDRRLNMFAADLERKVDEEIARVDLVLRQRQNPALDL